LNLESFDSHFFCMGIHVLFMSFVVINANWCPTRFPYQIMFVSFNSNNMGVTCGAGIRGGFSQSLQKIYKYFIESTFLLHFCLFNTLFHVYPTTARMDNFAGLVKRHLAGIFFTVVAPWQRDFRINSYNGQIVGLLSDWSGSRPKK
jgi:hypothetical protein